MTPRNARCNGEENYSCIFRVTERRMRHVHQTIRRHIPKHRNFNVHIVKTPKIKLLLGYRYSKEQIASLN